METLREDHKNMTQLLDLMESQIAAIRGAGYPAPPRTDPGVRC
jgi:hypothetical protein